MSSPDSNDSKELGCLAWIVGCIVAFAILEEVDSMRKRITILEIRVKDLEQGHRTSGIHKPLLPGKSRATNETPRRP